MTSLDSPAHTPLRAVQAAAWAVTAIMVAAIVTGALSAEDGAVAELVANVWARVTIIDLYATLTLVAAWIAWRERSTPRTIAWVIGLVLSGSVAVGAYVAIAAGRSRTMPELLCGPQDITLD